LKDKTIDAQVETRKVRAEQDKTTSEIEKITTSHATEMGKLLVEKR